MYLNTNTIIFRYLLGWLRLMLLHSLGFSFDFLKNLVFHFDSTIKECKQQTTFDFWECLQLLNEFSYYCNMGVHMVSRS